MFIKLNSLPNIFICILDFVDKYETCIHVQALKKIMCGFDSQNDIDAAQFTVSDIVQHSNDQVKKVLHVNFVCLLKFIFYLFILY